MSQEDNRPASDAASHCSRQDEITDRLKRGMTNFEAGNHKPAKQALREIAAETGINLDR